jgi:hypothetical protein
MINAQDKRDALYPLRSHVHIDRPFVDKQSLLFGGKSQVRGDRKFCCSVVEFDLNITPVDHPRWTLTHLGSQEQQQTFFF